jgi:benzoyl-CoA reductase subunit C
VTTTTATFDPTTATLGELVSWAESTARDTSFEAVQRWKERTGGLAVGYLPVYVPRELLHAMGVLPVAVMGAGDLEIIRGDAFYQSYICHLPRSVIELGLDGSLDLLDGMLFPATCDVIRNLSGMWKLKFGDKLARYLDVPQTFEEDLGGTFWRAELESLAEELQSRGARPLEPQALAESIALYNTERRLVHELYELRRTQPWTLPTAELYVVLRASLVIPVEESTALLSAYRHLALADEDRKPMDQARVVLAGSFCEQPPLGLLKTLERSGCYIVDDDLLNVHRWIRADIETGDDPMGGLVRAFLNDAVTSPVRWIDCGDKGADLVERVEQSGAEGVLFCAPSFCDPALLDQPMAVSAIEKAGIPWTAFKYSENTGQFQVIREQAGTFADSIKLWSEA